MSTPAPVVVAQLGCGYWGPNLARNFASLPSCELRYVADPSAERRAFVHETLPKAIAVETVDAILDDPDVGAVVVATPAASHFALAKQALEAGKHVLVEKPLATSVTEVDELQQCAARRGLIVMAGHTFVYNPAVRYVKTLIDSGDLGDIRYIYSQRLNLGRIRSDIDALWNFAPHDVSIIQYWLDDHEPTAVLRQGMDFIQQGVDDVVFLNLTYPNKVIANIHVSWLDPQKVRKMTVVGSKKMVVYDDVADDKIAIYDKGIDRKAVLGQHMDFDRPMPADFSYRSGDILLPHVKFVEPLRLEAQHFLDCIRTGKEPATGITHARAVVSILQRADALRTVSAGAAG
jgi:predicted dehydrogenase